MGFRWRPHECARVSPARPASESPRRTKPREASVTYGDLSETACASVSGVRVFWIAASRMLGIGRVYLRRSRDRQHLGRYFRGWQPAEAKVGLRGLGGTGKARRHCAFQQHVPAHDVSIRMIATKGCRYCGCIPRSKNSMTIMRPPQQGQGGRTVSAGLGLAITSAGGAEPSSSRSRATLAARPVLANSP